MSISPDDPALEPTPEQVDSALRLFWRGSTRAFDELLGADDPTSGPVSAIAGLLDAATHIAPKLDRRPGIAGYRLCDELGHGGMAAVYAALQERTGQTVAVKILQRWGTTHEEARYFHREVETLARLRHPNIAVIHDAGQVEDGRYYVAMEYVNGQSLAARIRASSGNPWNVHRLRSELGLFITICRAMQYAHQRGVIHRDLKPANIMIAAAAPDAALGAASNGKTLTPKILDFGLARVLDSDSTLITDAMHPSRLIGTLPYMSPEQVMGRNDEVDVRSDVYALGVILFEMLTGRRPFDALPGAAMRAQQLICETAPPRPSGMNPRIPAEIDTIILKSLAKEPVHRYQSAADLADDVERFLENRPILARDPGLAYRVRKFIARRRLVAALTAALLLSVIGSLAGLAIQARRLARERDTAQAQTRRAERVNEFLEHVLQSADPRLHGARVSIRDLLEQAARELDASLGGEPDLQARLHLTLARTYYMLRNYEPATAHARQAMELARKRLGDDHRLALAAQHHLGLIRVRTGDMAAADALIRGAHDARVKHFGDHDPEVAESILGLAATAQYSGRASDALQLFQRAVDIRRADATKPDALAEVLHLYGTLLVDLNHNQEAVPLLEEAIAIWRSRYGDDHPEIARALNDMTELRLNRGEFELAEAAAREQVRILRLLGDSYDLANALTDLGGLLATQALIPEAEKMLREAIDVQQRAMGDDEGDVALNLNDYGRFLVAQGRYFEAEPHAREVRRHWHRDTPGDHPAKAYADQNLGSVLLELGKRDEARELLTAADERWLRIVGPASTKRARALNDLARLAEFDGDRPAHVRLLAQVHALCVAEHGEDHAITAVAAVRWASARLKNGEASAERDLAAPLSIIRANAPRMLGDLSACLVLTADGLAANGRLDAAEPYWREAVSIERGFLREDHPLLADALIGVVRCELARGRVDVAAPLAQEAYNIRSRRLPAGDRRTQQARELLGQCHSEVGYNVLSEPTSRKSAP